MTDTVTYSLLIVAALCVVLGILRLRHVSFQGLVFGLSGAITGLLLGALASVPLSKLPGQLGSIMPVAVSVGLTILMIMVAIARKNTLLAIMPFLDPDRTRTHAPAPVTSPVTEPTPVAVSILPQILVDTSAIIDGRIADIATAGFVPGRLTVPKFVLAELQNIADSDDAMRRGRGRRGLDVLNKLRELSDVEVTIIDDDVPAIREVDAKLVALAQRFNCNVLTTDYNLNRVAQIQGVRVLNVNELSNAIRPVVLPGENLVVRVVQSGKERNQGVGYLADGTMIVVENGDKLIGQEVETEVTRVFQTVAGKMIFAVPRVVISSVATPDVAPAARESGPRPSASASSGNSVHEEPQSGNSGARKRFGRGRSNGAKHRAPNAVSSAAIEDRIVSSNESGSNPDRP
jgi:uncharacterized protein YacL